MVSFNIVGVRICGCTMSCLPSFIELIAVLMSSFVSSTRTAANVSLLFFFGEEEKWQNIL